MAQGYDDFDEKRIKHMEMIQEVVGRLANNSFLVKGWAITVAGAFFGFAVDRNDSHLALLGVLAAIAFYGLDAYFLHAERLFRALFDDVRNGNTKLEPFFMGATSPEFRRGLSGDRRDLLSWTKTTWRPTLLVFYGTLVLVGIAVAAGFSG